MSCSICNLDHDSNICSNKAVVEKIEEYLNNLTPGKRREKLQREEKRLPVLLCSPTAEELANARGRQVFLWKLRTFAEEGEKALTTKRR